MTPREHDPALDRVEREIQLAETLDRAIGVVSARIIATELAADDDNALSVFATTGSLHPARVFTELARGAHHGVLARRAAALVRFIEDASPLRSTKPETVEKALELEPANAVYLAPPDGLGSWIQLNRDRTEVRRIVRHLQHGHSRSRTPWTVQAHTGFYDLHIDPDESLDVLLEVAEGLETQGEPFAAYAHYMGLKRARIDQLAAHYYGCFQSIDEFVFVEAERRGWLAAIQQLIDSTGLGGLLSLDPDAVAARYFDSDAYGDWRQIRGRWGVHVLGPPRDTPG